MIGERTHLDPTVQLPRWTYHDDPTANNLHLTTLSPVKTDQDYSLLAYFQRYLPSATDDFEELDVPVDAYTCDNFRMYEFKVRKCARAKSHDWTECPYSHPGEKASRRDPRKYHYSGTGCPEFRRGMCKKGDGCEFAHGVFECWLHPSRYRTQPCKDGVNCERRVCFFAHTPEQLRVTLSQNPSPRTDSSYDGSPRYKLGCFSKRLQFASSSPESGSPLSESPPMSPLTPGSVNEMLAYSLRQLQLNNVKSMPSSWNIQMGCSSGFGSTRPGFLSLPSTPNQVMNRTGFSFEEEPVMERVESGKDLRAKMFEKLCKENPLDGSGHYPDPDPVGDPNPDVDWVSELIQ